ncbi:MAG: hypothetical protein LBQ13_01290 [Endomicrobium sp.]|jgi:hypothetical protein|nr:hypothetical protein [Endomicrobium sp.]
MSINIKPFTVSRARELLDEHYSSQGYINIAHLKDDEMVNFNDRKLIDFKIIETNIAALWNKINKTGSEYYTGKFGDKNIVIFKGKAPEVDNLYIIFEKRGDESFGTGFMKKDDDKDIYFGELFVDGSDSDQRNIVPIVVKKNKNKINNQPDWHVYKAELKVDEDIILKERSLLD